MDKAEKLKLLDEMSDAIGMSLQEHLSEMRRIERGEPMLLEQQRLIKTPNGWFRWRRGKLVRIPDEWKGRATSEQTIRKRQSKQVRRGKPKPYERAAVTSEDDQDAPCGKRRDCYKDYGRMPRERKEKINRIMPWWLQR